MTPNEAIQILDQVVSQVPLVWADQQKVRQALAVMRDATMPKDADAKQAELVQAGLDCIGGRHKKPE